MKKIFVVILLITSTHSTFSQGCSDAGFCTLNGFKPYNQDSSYTTLDSLTTERNEISLGLNYGKADNDIITFGSYIDYKRELNRFISFNVKLTALNQQGNNISNTGVSDIYVTSNYKFKSRIGITTGFKFPLNDGNQSKNALSLPLDYQPSLGTIDYLLGISTSINKLQIVAAWQQPLTQNENKFLAETYPENSKLRDFQSTNNFNRAGDVLLRLSYPIKVASKLMITPGLLSIYHIKEDQYTAINGKNLDIKGSDGLTLNSNLYFDYKLNNKQYLQFNTAVPFIVRTVRPDGLTRSLVVSFEFKQRF